MRRAPLPALLLPALLLLAPGAARADAFDRLMPLVGHWRGTADDGRPLDIRYRLIAGGSALVETWRSAGGRETMTVYHRDGPATVATHYCAQGNQPLLAAAPSKVGAGADGRIAFSIRSVTNLARPGAAHLVRFWIELAGEVLRRSETYAEDGREATEGAVLRRVAG